MYLQWSWSQVGLVAAANNQNQYAWMIVALQALDNAQTAADARLSGT
jgi:hypothetical protein